MTLKEWIDKTNNTQIAIANRLKMDKGRLSRILAGEQEPTLYQAHEIYKLTKGKVKLEDWLGAK